MTTKFSYLSDNAWGKIEELAQFKYREEVKERT